MISGEIIREMQLGKCFEIMQYDTIIIMDTSSFMDLRNQIDPEYYAQFNSECDTIMPDTLNFDQYSLIGYYASGTGCNVNFHKNFIRDEMNKQYSYTVSVEECGDCSIMEFSMNWIVVEKIDTTFTFIFETINNN